MGCCLVVAESVPFVIGASIVPATTIAFHDQIPFGHGGIDSRLDPLVSHWHLPGIRGKTWIIEDPVEEPLQFCRRRLVGIG